MKLLGPSALLVILLLLLLGLHPAQPGRKWRRKPVKKPGFCPEFFLGCPFVLLPLCRRDGHCTEDEKCCFYNCRQQCMEPWYSLE